MFSSVQLVLLLFIWRRPTVLLFSSSVSTAAHIPLLPLAGKAFHRSLLFHLFAAASYFTSFLASCLLPILSQESATSPQWTSHPILPASKPHFPDNLSNSTPASFHPCFALLLRSECIPLLMIMFGKSVTALTLIGHNGMTVR